MTHLQAMTLWIVVGSLILMWGVDTHANGTIMGRVTFSGKVPPSKEFTFSKFPNSEFCRTNPNKNESGKIRFLKEIEVTKDGALKNAIVSVRNITGKNWLKNERLVNLCESSPQKMEQACAGVPRTEAVMELCEIFPYTGVVVNNGRFYVENHDADPEDPKAQKGVLHSPHGFDVLGAKSTTLFNIPLPKKGDSLNERIDMRMAREGSVMRLQCDQHEFMQAWFLPVDNPYFAKVNDDGTYEIRNVPAGTHTILAWHPIAGNITTEVDVPDEGTVEVNFAIESSGRIRKAPILVPY